MYVCFHVCYNMKKRIKIHVYRTRAVVGEKVGNVCMYVCTCV